MVLTGIEIVYGICLAVGFSYALISAIFSEIGGHGGTDAGGHGLDHSGPDIGGHGLDVGPDADVSHDFGGGGHSVALDLTETSQFEGASFLNGLTMSVLVGMFGLAGLFATFILKLGPMASLAFALPTALIAAVAQFVLYVKVFVQAQGSSEATMAEVLGCEAEVITSIPGDRVGEIAYVIKGTRYSAPAVSADSEEIARGSRVQVVNIRGTTLVVRPV